MCGPREDPGRDSAAALFEAEPALEGVDDGLNPLTDPGDLPVPGGFVLAVRPHQVNTEPIGEEGFELLAREALVGKDHLPGQHEAAVAFQQRGHHLPLPDRRVGQAPGDGHAFGGGDQVEPKAPEEPGVAAAVAVSGLPGRLGAFDGLAKGGTGQRDGVDQPQVAVPGRHLPGQGLDHVADQRAGGVEPLVVGGLPGQVAEEVSQPGVGEADPVPGRGEDGQRLHRLPYRFHPIALDEVARRHGGVKLTAVGPDGERTE